MERKLLIGILQKLRLAGAAYQLKEFFYQLLRVDLIRATVAGVRYFYFVVIRRRLRTLEPATGDIGINTVLHNRLRMKKFHELAVTRSNLLLYPLSAIHISRSVPVLCIGPRTEGELLNLLGLRFRNVRGLDLISYSPWVDCGDMHAMPYQDDAFGAIIMGWCFAYSDNRRKAAQEAVRVSHHGAIIAVGVEYRKESSEELSKKVGYQVPDEKRLESVTAILELFSPHVDHVFFSQDLPSPPTDKCELLTLFSIKK